LFYECHEKLPFAIGQACQKIEGCSAGFGAQKSDSCAFYPEIEGTGVEFLFARGGRSRIATAAVSFSNRQRHASPRLNLGRAYRFPEKRVTAFDENGEFCWRAAYGPQAGFRDLSVNTSQTGINLS